MYVATRISKRFGGVVALDGASLTLEPGTVHALLGENGAGKSTLVKVLAGALRPDEGTLELRGEAVRYGSTRQAAARGVAVVSQELSLFPDLDVLANLFPACRPRRAGVLIDRAAMAARAAPVLAELEFHRPVGTRVAELTLAERQLVEIARALLEDPAVLILDEPTSALQSDAVARLLRILAALRARQVGVVYVSHLLEEVLQLCDAVTVLRDGRNVLSGAPIGEVTIDSIVHAMLGDRTPAPEPSAASPEAAARPGAEAGPRRAGVTLRGVTVPGVLRGVDLTVGHGEIVGLAGLAGAGQTAVLEVVCGLRNPAEGEVRLPGGAPRPRSLERAISGGVAVVPSDRKRLGLMLDKPLWENIAQVRAVALGRTGTLLRTGDLRARTSAAMRRLGIRAAGPDQTAGQLSGGNQQKVVFAKWLEAGPEVVLLDDPTRGVDVGAKAEMHAIVRELAAEGRVVLLTSTDLGELVQLCDRVVVFRKGRVAAELSGAELTEQEILRVAATGRNGNGNTHE
ncbi:sugar ABC transporter ATP-binding protein [Nonomuraea sp. NPDC046570]|uniref:sugar ABC transporter ATP-binding protein n=1 Tax=Nonomuraea sp. NPDC046570 TaxID=3155255 RepID=UPI0033D2FE84